MRVEGGGRCSDPAALAEGSIIIKCCFLLLINYLILANYGLSSFFVYWCYKETNSVLFCYVHLSVNLLLNCRVNLLSFGAVIRPIGGFPLPPGGEGRQTGPVFREKRKINCKNKLNQ